MTLRLYSVATVLFMVVGCAFSRPVSESLSQNSDTDAFDLQEADLQARLPGKADNLLQHANFGETDDLGPNENALADPNGGYERQEDQRSAAEVILQRVRRRSRPVHRGNSRMAPRLLLPSQISEQRTTRPVHRGHRMASRFLPTSQISEQRTARPKRMMPWILSPLSSKNVATTQGKGSTFTQRGRKAALGKKCKWCGLNYFLKKVKVYGDWNRKHSLHRYV
ncbi:uncharacterized protein LOC144903163 [Branchiostoma floridae x Branchiostoma belcheri]